MKVQKSIETEKFHLYLGENEVLYLLLKDYFMLDVPHQNWLLMAYKYLCEDQKYPLVTEGIGFIEYDKEVVHFINKHKEEFPLLSNALIVNQTGHLLVASFFTRFTKLPIPVKIFKKKDKAVKWAKKQRQEHLAQVDLRQKN